ncbi:MULTISPECIES: hypothetical protein [Lysobacter]|uniref:Uncharacterized protein n=1 Tax=Lysobacter firmicutimachus TaxID=1792846 RepID=A0ABU8D629_9GAMM|nr:hypothetical protein [Lysobacter antibioticus]
MSPRGWIALALLLSAVGWWYSPISPRALHYPAPAQGASVRCPMPPRVRDYAEPLQTPVPAGLRPFRLVPGTLTPLAGFSIEGRVLSRRDYRNGLTAEFSPTDLGIGWGRMREEAVLSKLRFSQEVRFLTYRFEGEPPIPLQEMQRSSANLHIIPADAEVARALKRTHKDQRVRVHGWLVLADAGGGWRWQSSLTRTDTGDGACELVYACAIEPL